jgi:hypothetical protein
MAGFWFLVSVVLVIILLSRPKNVDSKNDSYAQGYWNGYRAFGDMVRDLIKEKRIDEESLRSLINFGETGGTPQNTAQSSFVDPNADAIAPKPAATDPEARFYADTYGDLAGQDDEVIETFDGTLAEPDIAPHSYTAPAAVVAPRVVEMTADQKAARSLRNLNIILYTASFLLVAAGALFVASSSSPLTKLISVIIIIAAFYVTGIVMYAKSVRLRPAALAFLGTGLALIPFAGLALQQFTNLSTAQSWLITSTVGLLAYFVVAVRLQSLLVSYLTMAFVLSLAGSMTAAAASAIVWQFVAIIGVSLATSIVASIKPKWLPTVFSQPVERSGQIVTPVVLVASLFVFDKLLLAGYEIVFAVATLHYIVAWIQTRSIVFETITRILAYVVLALVSWDVWNGTIALVAFTMVMSMTLQQAYSLYMVKRPGRSSTEQAWLLILFGLQFMLVWFWVGYPLAAVFSTIALTTIGLTSLAAAIRLRMVGYGVIGLFVSVLLPFIVGRGLLVSDLSWWVMASWFMLAAVASLWLYARWRHRSVALRYFMTAAYMTYLFFAICVAGLERSSAFMALIFAATTAVSLTASYLSRKPGSQIVASLFIVLATVYLGDVLQIAQPWRVMFVCVISAVILWMMTIIHGHFNQAYRQTLALASGQVIFFMLFIVIIFNDVQASKIMTALLLVAAFGSLALRWLYRTKAPHLNVIFSISYVAYFVVSFLGAALISDVWWAGVAALGVVLFTLASFVERQPLIQIVASVLALAALSLIASLIDLPYHWRPLFVFGGGAVLFYLAAVAHHVFSQMERRLAMLITGQIAAFMVIFGGLGGHRDAIIASYVILLVWATLSLAARWWSRTRSQSYGFVFLMSYPVYYFGAILLLGLLASTWSWMVAAAVGVVLSLAASYIEKQLWLQIVASVFVIATLGFIALLIGLPSQWTSLFVFGGSAVLFFGLTLFHQVYGQRTRRFMMTVAMQCTLFWIVLAGLSGDDAATKVSFITMLTWALGSLVLRWWYRDRSPDFSQIFLASYPAYYFGALFLLAPLMNIWSYTAAAAVGIVLFTLASYVERQLWLQFVAAISTVATLWFTASLLHVPYEWWALFIFGGSAVLFYAGTIVHAFYGQKARQLLMTKTAHGILFLIVLTGLGGHHVATLIAYGTLLAWSVLTLALRYYCRDRSPNYVRTYRLFYPLYYVGALLLLSSLPVIWSVVAFAVGAAVFWIASYVERAPEVSILGDVLLAVTLFVFWDSMHYGDEWKTITIASILAAIFYASHWMLTNLGDVWRGRVQLIATWISLGSVIVLQSWDETKIIAVSTMIVAFALTLAVHGWQTKRYALVETALYVATFGLQRIGEQVWPDLNSVVYAHWWAATIAAVSLIRRTHRRARLVVAMSLVTLSSGIYALMTGGNYQLLFLIEHLALLVAGALLSKSWAIWWGISAAAVAILYFLRGYTFLLLGFLGLLMIAIVVWRLMTGNKTVK